MLSETTANAKPIVFISHIDEEKTVAILLKDLLTERFLGMVEVFVSSDAGSISMGQKWLSKITSALKTCSVEIVICSPWSVTEPWIHFEAGAVYIRTGAGGGDIPVIPLCHSGVKPSELPMPLNLLQGAEATDVPGLKLVLPVIASAVGCDVPDVDFDPFVAEVRAFEEGYTYWSHVNAAFQFLNATNPKIVEMLRTSQPVTDLKAPESAIAELEGKIQFLKASNILSIKRLSRISIGDRGMTQPIDLVPLDNLQATFDNPNFVFHSPEGTQ